MAEIIGSSPHRFRFSLRQMFLLMLILAVACGWYAHWRAFDREKTRLRKLQEHLRSAILFNELKEKVEQPISSSLRKAPNSVLSHSNLEWVNLKGVSLSGNFQNSNFDHSDLEGASLTGGVSSFQKARFENANLKRARLSGKGSSFQLASFNHADLSEAQLSGNFQCANFQDANLRGAKISTNMTGFQAVKLDGAQFPGANLSQIPLRSLQSCHFSDPPTYDKNTIFPNGFDPAIELWKKVD